MQIQIRNTAKEIWFGFGFRVVQDSVQHITVWRWSHLAPIDKTVNGKKNQNKYSATMERYKLSSAIPIGAKAAFLQLGGDIHPFHCFANSF